MVTTHNSQKSHRTKNSNKIKRRSSGIAEERNLGGSFSVHVGGKFVGGPSLRVRC